MTVCFVCTGNTCRSPMAEAYLAHVSRQRGIAEAVRVCSAGVSAGGGSISEYSHVVLDSEGVDVPPGQSCSLTRAAVRDADLIVTMTKAHKDVVTGRFPEAQGKTQTLMSFVNSNADVADPIGGTIKEYQDCLDAMKPALEAIADWLTAETEKRADAMSGR